MATYNEAVHARISNNLLENATKLTPNRSHINYHYHTPDTSKAYEDAQ
jgi:hypothetical protein